MPPGAWVTRWVLDTNDGAAQPLDLDRKRREGKGSFALALALRKQYVMTGRSQRHIPHPFQGPCGALDALSGLMPYPLYHPTLPIRLPLCLVCSCVCPSPSPMLHDLSSVHPPSLPLCPPLLHARVRARPTAFPSMPWGTPPCGWPLAGWLQPNRPWFEGSS